MNSLIDSLNLWGERSLNLAWPLLWQSSLLIALLFAFDLAFRHRVRAAVRYALWLVVLVKLVLPPSLALPTGVAWWLPSAKPAPAPKPQPNYVVTYGSAHVRRTSPVIVTPYAPPPPTLAAGGWALVAWAGVGLALLGWLGVRWRQVTRDIRHAAPGEAWLEDLLATTQHEAGLRWRVRLRLTERPMSPAVCGLIRPVILLPRGLVEQLPPAQLRAVLLHELVHLRRGDVWVNCLQALLQIGYWWHPLIWLANVRIRRVREEAVDDAVMLALRDEADYYAPTLLEVAKLAFHRPLASLGLVGILESRSALRQRIERLVNFQPPRRAGLSVVAGMGIAAFAAIAVPMGEAPRKADTGQASVNTVSATPQTGATANPNVAEAQWLDLVEQLVGDYPDLPIAALTAHSTFSPAELGGFGRPVVMPSLPVLGDLPLLRLFRSELNPLLFDPLAETSALHFNRVGALVKTDAPLSTRVFRFDRKALDAEIRKQTGLPEAADETQLAEGFRVVLGRLGVELDPSIPWFQSGLDRRMQRLLVRSTAVELDRIEAFFAELGASSTQPPASHVTPNGNAPARGDLEDADDRTAHEPASTPTQTSTLVQDGKLLLELGKLDEAEAKLKAALKISPDSDAVSYYLDLVRDARNRQAGGSATKAQTRTNLVYVGKGRQMIISKLSRITFPQTQAFDGLPLSEVVRSLNEESKRRDPDQRGVHFIVNQTAETSPKSAPWPTVDSNTGQPIQPDPSHPGMDASFITIRLPGLTGVTLAELLEAIVKAAEQPIKFSIEEYAVVFSLRGQEIRPLSTRVFKVDPSTFQAAVWTRAGLSQTNGLTQLVAAIRGLLAGRGVKLEAPSSIFYNDRQGSLLVRAAHSELDAIQSLLQELNDTPPQVNIQAKFIEMSEAAYLDFCATHAPTNRPDATNWTPSSTRRT